MITSPNIVASVTTNDQQKYIQARLIQRSYLRLVAYSMCEMVQLPQGYGKTANMVRYERMNVPLTPVTEGVDPVQNTFTLTTVSVTLDQWSDVVAVSDVVIETTFHPVIQQVVELLSDDAMRVIDREIQIVWLAGTSVQYGDGSVTARSSITTAMKVSDTVLHQQVINLINNGAPPRGGPAGGVVMEGGFNFRAPQEGGGNARTGGPGGSGGPISWRGGEGGSVNQGQAYVAVAGAQVMRDIMQTGTSLGTWAAVAMYANQKALYNGEVGTWLNIRFVETNFIAKFTMLGNTTAVVASGSAFGSNTPTVTDQASGGTLNASATYYFKVTMKDQLRGFEEQISVAHTIATGAGGGNAHSIQFAFPSNTGFVYNLYFDNTQGGGTGTDANLFLVQANIANNTTVTVSAIQTTGSNPPGNVNTTGSPAIFPVYIFGAEAVNWFGLQSLQVFISQDIATTDNPAKLRRTFAYKFMGKAVIRDQKRMTRLELASSYT